MLSNVCSIIIAAHGCRRALRRTPRLVELHVSRGLLAPRRTRRSGRGGRACRARADRPRRALRRGPLRQSGQRAEAAGDLRRRANARDGRPGPDPAQPPRASGERGPDAYAADRPAGRERARLREPLRTDLARAAARAQTRRARAARRFRRPHRRAHRALRRRERSDRKSAAARATTTARSRSARACAISFPAASISSCSTTYGPKTARSCKRSCALAAAARRAVRRDQRRRVRRPRGRAAVRRAHLREVQDDAAHRRHAVAPERGVPAQDARANGAAVRRLSARDREHARDRRTLHVPARKARRAVSATSRFPKAKRAITPTCARSSTTARANATAGRSPRRSSGNSNTSSASSRAWISPATFWSCGTSRAKPAQLGVLGQGRGSAANSAVCYALGITAVDPIAGDLLFERFLSEERNEIPDIDIDFAHQDREAGAPVRLRPLRPPSRRDDGRSDHLPHALGDSRRRQSAGTLARSSRSDRARIRRAANRSPKRSASHRLQRRSTCRRRSTRRRDFDAGSNIVPSRGTPLRSRLRRGRRHARAGDRAGTPPLRGPIGGETRRAAARAVPAHRRLSAPHGDPFGRHGHHARSADERRAGRVGVDARPHDRAVGQGRSERSRA